MQDSTHSSGSQFLYRRSNGLTHRALGFYRITVCPLICHLCKTIPGQNYLKNEPYMYHMKLAESTWRKILLETEPTTRSSTELLPFSEIPYIHASSFPTKSMKRITKFLNSYNTQRILSVQFTKLVIYNI